jgi:alpha-beta hydrolase superfamily lysophospholipase
MKTLLGLLFIFVLADFSQAQWNPDQLGSDFEQHQLKFPNDYDGEVIATLVRMKSGLPDSSKAILYIHGFNDYFFQKHLAAYFVEHGFRFYALDLRKYGRSILPHQVMCDVRDLHEYFPEIDSSLAIINTTGSGDVTLMGHSTGGLISALYASEHQNSTNFTSLVLNSPFFDMNLNIIMENMVTPMGELLGEFFPETKLSSDLPIYYFQSIHKDYNGEWDFDLNLKPIISPDITLGWIRAIRQGQKTIQAGITISQPVLVLHSDKSILPHKWSDDLFKVDAVLDIEDIKKYSKKIQGNVKVVEIPGALHDVILSKKPVRDLALETMLNFIQSTEKFK